MADHILLKMSVRRAHLEAPIMQSGAEYRARDGLWYGDSNAATYLRPPMTKKHDIESGEDMKGE